jgi:hypothetical protein
MPRNARTEAERKLWLMESWAMLDRQERFVFNKLLTGSFIGVSKTWCKSPGRYYRD